MQVDDILLQTREMMEKSLSFTENQLSKIRTGRASSSLVDTVRADYYGSLTPLSQMATISTPDARTLVIQPFDRTTLPNIEKAIQQADLGFNPQNDGNVIRIPVPPLTEERRKEFVKLSKKTAEEGKIVIRNIRRDNIEEFRKSEKSKDITEDDLKYGEIEVQKITDEFTGEIDKLFVKKEKELLED
jgi:ribosome recycling factor